MAKISGTGGGGRRAYGGPTAKDTKSSPEQVQATRTNNISIGLETELRKIFPSLSPSALRELSTALLPHNKKNFRDLFLLETSAFLYAHELLKRANIKPNPETVRRACRGGIPQRRFLETIFDALYKEMSIYEDRFGIRKLIADTLSSPGKIVRGAKRKDVASRTSSDKKSSSKKQQWGLIGSKPKSKRPPSKGAKKRVVNAKANNGLSRGARG